MWHTSRSVRHSARCWAKWLLKTDARRRVGRRLLALSLSDNHDLKLSEESRTSRAVEPRAEQVAHVPAPTDRCGGTGACCSSGVLTQLERGRGLLRDVVELPKRPGRLRNIAQFVQVKVERVVFWQPIWPSRPDRCATCAVLAPPTREVRCHAPPFNVYRCDSENARNQRTREPVALVMVFCRPAPSSGSHLSGDVRFQGFSQWCSASRGSTRGRGR